MRKRELLHHSRHGKHDLRRKRQRLERLKKGESMLQATSMQSADVCFIWDEL